MHFQKALMLALIGIDELPADPDLQADRQGAARVGRSRAAVERTFDGDRSDIGDPGSATLADQPKVFGLFSMVLFAVSAILVADTVATSAAIGVQGITFWVALAILFFIPYGFVTAELGSAWPEEGGIYVWVREAFGPRWATMTAWLYWVNVAYWAPSVFVLFAGTLARSSGAA